MKIFMSHGRKSIRKMLLSFIVSTLLMALPAFGADYFVSKQGDDANVGQAADTAFLTIQKGVNALTPGDTLTIGAGEYFETVKRENLGSMDVDTIIRAEIPGTAVIRGDVDLPEFEKVDGYRFVYVTNFDSEPLCVLEHDTLSVFPKRPSMEDVEYEPGTYYFDAAQKKLYLSSSDMLAPTGRRYGVSMNAEHAINLSHAKRVTIDGLAMGGTCIGWSILLEKPASCTIRNCTMYLGEGGIIVNESAGNNVIENCASYGHTFGGIVFYYARNDTVRNCRLYETKREGEEHFGVMHYHDMRAPLLIQDCISWGQNFDYSVKPAQTERLERCVAMGSVRNGNIFNSLIGGGNEYDHDSTKTPADNILFLREKDLDRDLEFADPLNLDFRLQPDSRFCGTGPDGADRGPYPYEANIFYLSPTGDDGADGLSMRKPWQTMKHAFSNLRPGDTLYLAEGSYAAASWKNAGDEKSPIRICARGRDTVVITGNLNLTEAAGVVFERLNFADGAALDNSSDVTFNNCTFYGSKNGLNANKIDGLKTTHCVFKGVSLRGKKSSGLHISSNLFANACTPAVQLDSATAILYSDYNSYQDKATTWQVDGSTLSLADLQMQHDGYSKALVPEFCMENGTPQLKNSHLFAGRGMHSTALGIHHAYIAEAPALELVGPILHSVSDTTVNIEWWTSKPANFDLAWGETPETTNTIENVKAPNCFTTYSLTDLKPDTTYYFQIKSADTTGRGTEFFNTVLKPETAPLAFTTLADAPKPAVYYVAPDGDDANTGSSREQAWRTVSHAADMVNVGDTVLISGGDYKGTVRIRATGDAERPITFQCAPGEKVVFHGKGLNEAFKVIVKKNIHFDGLYFADFGASMNAVFVMWDADGTQITRCLNVKGNANISFVKAEYSSDVLVKNCVAAGGFSCVQFFVSPDFRVENNLFLRPLIYTMHFVNKPDQKGYFRKNIVTDNLPYKVNAPLFEIGRYESFVEEDNCYFLRIAEDERKLFMFYGTAAYMYPNYGITADFDTPPVFVDNPDGSMNNPRMTVKEYQAMAGETGSYVGDPKFAGNAGVEEGGTLWTGDPSTMFDKLIRDNLDFPDTFATDPKAIEKGVGPQPAAFEDFWFNKTK